MDDVLLVNSISVHLRRSPQHPFDAVARYGYAEIAFFCVSEGPLASNIVVFVKTIVQPLESSPRGHAAGTA